MSTYNLLRINGYPGNYVRIAGKWRLEEVRFYTFIPVLSKNVPL